MRPVCPLILWTRHDRGLPSSRRWGLEEAFETEMARRKAKAESSYEARKRAHDQRATASASPTSAGPGSLDSGTPATEQAPGKLLPYPSPPRILNLGNENNYVGMNQQERNRVCGEEYGFSPW